MNSIVAWEIPSPHSVETIEIIEIIRIQSATLIGNKAYLQLR